MTINRWMILVVAAAAVGCKGSDPAKESGPSGAGTAPAGSGASVAPKATDPATAVAVPATAAAIGGPPPAGLIAPGVDVDLPPSMFAAPADTRKGGSVDTVAAPEVDDLPVQSFGGVSTSRGFRVSYMPGPDDSHKQMGEALEKARVFEGLTEALNGLVRVPRAVDVQVGACGMVNAFYDPRRKRIVMCHELMQYFGGLFAKAAEKSGKPMTNEELSSAVIGATNFAFFHEAGHGLIDMLDLAAVGRQEDAVDQLATLILIGGGDQGVGMALAAAYWFKVQHEAGQDKTPFSDEHAFDGQRYYNILCMVYGSNPRQFAGIATGGSLPEDRARRCPNEFKDVAGAWEKLLRPHLANRAATRVAMKPALPADETEGGEDDVAALVDDPNAGGAAPAATPGLKALPPAMQAKYDAMTPDEKKKFDELRMKAAGAVTAAKGQGCEMLKTLLGKNKTCAAQAQAAAAIDCKAPDAYAKVVEQNTACVEVLRAKGEEYKAAARPNSCEKVAAHARGLLFKEIVDQIKTMPPAKGTDMRARVKAELPAFQEALLAECAQKQWSDADRACVLGAKTLADARGSCNM